MDRRERAETRTHASPPPSLLSTELLLANAACSAEGNNRVRLYNWLSQRCFSDCVVTFYRKALGKREGDCVRACVHKYLLVSSASAARFAELADPAASSSAAFDD